MTGEHALELVELALLRERDRLKKLMHTPEVLIATLDNIAVHLAEFRKERRESNP